MKYFFGVLLAGLYVVNASALSVSNPTVAAGLSAPVLSSVSVGDAEKIRTIATLEDDITILDAELKKCEKGKKGWIAATVIGSAGVVATGVAAGVQGAQITNKKQELAGHNTDISQKQQQLQQLQGQN